MWLWSINFRIHAIDGFWLIDEFSWQSHSSTVYLFDRHMMPKQNIHRHFVHPDHVIKNHKYMCMKRSLTICHPVLMSLVSSVLLQLSWQFYQPVHHLYKIYGQIVHEEEQLFQEYCHWQPGHNPVKNKYTWTDNKILYNYLVIQTSTLRWILWFKD